MRNKLKKHRYLLVILVVVGALLRFYKLGVVPSGATNDEIGFMYNAYSLFTTGKNIYGVTLPFITRIGVPFLPVQTYLIAPFVGILGLSAFTGRMLNAILGVGEIALLYWLVVQIFSSRKIAFWAGLALAISPWHLQLTRSAYDPVSALFFYLLAVNLFIYAVNKKKSILIALPPLLLVVFSYRAMNIILLPTIALLVMFNINYIKTIKRELILFAVGVLAILGLFFYITNIEGKEYVAEVFAVSESPLNFAVGAQDVNRELRESIAPLFVSRIFSNKILYSLRQFRENYIGFFSTNYLFTAGDPNPIYSLWWRGMLYIIELPLIIFGLIYLYKKNSKSANFIVLSILISPLPSALSGPTYVARSFNAVPYLMVLVGAGIVYYFEWVTKFRSLILRYLLISIFSFIYVFQLGSYLHQYYNRYSIYGAAAWFRSMRDLSDYVSNEKQNYKKVIYANASTFEILHYSFWTKTDPIVVQQALSNGSSSANQIENILFVQDCINNGVGDPKESISVGELYIVRSFCHTDATPSATIKELGKDEVIWKAYQL